MNPINEQKKLELAIKVLDFLQLEIQAEGYRDSAACNAQVEVLVLAVHASTDVPGFKRLFA